jgi:hypothetical protein
MWERPPEAPNNNIERTAATKPRNRKREAARALRPLGTEAQSFSARPSAQSSAAGMRR